MAIPLFGAKPGEVVYVIGNSVNNIVKIGWTSVTAERRCGQIQNMSPLKLHVMWTTPGGLGLETALHKRFDEHRIHGEWFDFGNADPVIAVESAVDQMVMESFDEPACPDGDAEKRWDSLSAEVESFASWAAANASPAVRRELPFLMLHCVENLAWMMHAFAVDLERPNYVPLAQALWDRTADALMVARDLLWSLSVAEGVVDDDRPRTVRMRLSINATGIEGDTCRSWLPLADLEDADRIDTGFYVRVMPSASPQRAISGDVPIARAGRFPHEAWGERESIRIPVRWLGSDE